MSYLKSSRSTVVLAALLLASATGAWAATSAKSKKPSGLERYGVAVYSDLCLQKDSGEIGGQRVTLHRFAEADSVVYEFTAGALSMPIVASDVNIDDASGAFDFTISGPDNEERTFNGNFSRDGKTLTLAGDYCGGNARMPMKLSRVTDFGKPLKTCTPCPAAPAEPAAPATPATPGPASGNETPVS